MKQTKKKILDVAILLFNEGGLPNVRLQNIADYCEISVGNLAYHYQTKEILLSTIDQHIQNEINQLITETKSFRFIIDFDNQLSNYFHCIKQYSFYFLDILELERTYPDMHKHRVLLTNKLINQIYDWLTQNVELGIIRKEIIKGQYLKTANSIWLMISFWMTQQQVLGNEPSNEGKFKEQIWNQVLPIFTENGLLEFEALIMPQLQNYENAIDTVFDK